MQLRKNLPLALGTAALAFGVAACGDSGDKASTTVVEQSTVTRTVTAPPATTPATTPQTTSQPAAPLTLQQAEQVLEQRGFAPLGERDWRPDQTLKVLIGFAGEASMSGQEQAFFFVGDRFIGTDARAPSGRVTVTAQEDQAITLSYGLYRPKDSIESPTGGEAEVTFVWDGTSLTPQQPIPSAAQNAPLSRR